MTDQNSDLPAFRILYPQDFFSKFYAQGVRPDGRPLGRTRPTTVGTGAVPTADGSAMVKIGNTTMLAAIKLEVMTPSQEALDKGSLEVEFEMPPLCSPKVRPGRPSESVHTVAEEITNALAGTSFLNLEQLCIQPARAAWLAKLDIICLDADGALIDAALLAAVAALADLKLPEVKLTAKGRVIPTGEDMDTDKDPRDTKDGAMRVPSRRLKLGNVPVALTCALFGSHLLVDPTAEELTLGITTLTVVVDTEDRLVSLFKPGGALRASIPVIQDCIVASKLRNKEVVAVLQDTDENIRIAFQL